MVIVDCGRAFEFLSWYRPVAVVRATVHKPALEELMGEIPWRLRNPGTCSPVHFKRLELERISTVAIDREKLRREFSALRPGTSKAVGDISMAETLSVLRPLPAGQPVDRHPPVRSANPHVLPTVDSLCRILESGSR